MNELERNIKDECFRILSRAEEWCCSVEVVASAFQHKEQFPDASLLECLQVGADEWDVSY